MTPDEIKERDELFLALESACDRLNGAGLRYLAVRDFSPLLNRVADRMGKDYVRKIRREKLSGNPAGQNEPK